VADRESFARLIAIWVGRLRSEYERLEAALHLTPIE
jgi:hypothetical protein